MADDVFAVARRGRRRANVSVARDRRMELRLSNDEFLLLESLAQAQGVSKQAVLMRAVLTGGSDAAARVDRMRDELRSLRLLLANVANNMNQLAHQANSFALGGDEPINANELRAATNKIVQLSDNISDFFERASLAIRDHDAR